MHRIRFLCIFGIITSINFLSATTNPRAGLLIFLDGQEKDYMGAVSGNMLIALSEKAGPILASTSLIKNVFSEYDKDITDASYGSIFKGIDLASKRALNESLKDLFDELEDFQTPKKIDALAQKAAYKYILLQGLRFDPNQWIIKKVNHDLCLFIPLAYLNAHNIDASQVKLDGASEISATELQLGLRVNHMQTTSIEAIIQAPYQLHDPHYFVQALYNHAQHTSDIFCIRSEYHKRSFIVPSWTIFLLGHGSDKKIANLEIADLKNVLDFLEHKILCNMFFYSSCFSGGINIKSVYEELENNIQKTYSFPIIIDALTDATTFIIAVPIVQLDDHDNINIVSDNNHSFAKFLQAAAADDIYDYKNILQHITTLDSQVRPNEAPQIKLPGLAWFSILDTDHIVAIGDILAMSRSASQPLILETFFKKNPSILLLYASHILFPIILNSRLNAIVSMIPGDAVHTISQLSSAHHAAENIIRIFMQIHGLQARKIFFINEVIGTDTSVYNVVIAYTKLNGRYLCKAYYTDGTTVYIKNSLVDKPQKASADDILMYQMYAEAAINHKITPFTLYKGSLLPLSVDTKSINTIQSTLQKNIRHNLAAD